MAIKETVKDLLEPVLHIIHRARCDRVDMKRSFGKVFEHQDEIEVLQPVLHTFERGDLDVCERHYKEGRVGKVNKAVSGRLQACAGTEWYTLKREFTEGDVDLQGFAKLGTWSVTEFLSEDERLTELEAASAIFSANAFTSLLSVALLFLSCCSISISSSSP
jgi:hypothetical protein